MLGLIGLGLIGIGNNIRINTDNKNDQLNRIITNEKIYTIPEDNYILTQLSSEITPNQNSNSNLIIKIPHNLINNKYLVGKIKLNKITNFSEKKYKLDEFNNLIIEKKIKEKKTEPFLKKILFPSNILENYGIDYKFEPNDKTEILFNNSIVSKSKSFKTLYDKFKNTITFSHSNTTNLTFSDNFDIVQPYNDNVNFELVENYITERKDVYLLIDDALRSNGSNENKILNILIICDNKDKIIKKKYQIMLNEVELGYISSFSLITIGIGVIIGSTLVK